jgi:hypothetical protein
MARASRFALSLIPSLARANQKVKEKDKEYSYMARQAKWLKAMENVEGGQ